MQAILKVPARHAFCIFLSTSSALLPTSFCGVASESLDHPPKTPIMILYRAISYPGYVCFISHLSGAYFMVFSDVFSSRLLTQGQLIASSMTCLCWVLTILTSTLFALNSLRAAIPKFRLEVCKMKKSKIPKLCQNLGLDEQFLEKIL